MIWSRGVGPAEKALLVSSRDSSPMGSVEQRGEKQGMKRMAVEALIQRFILENFLFSDDGDLVQDDVSFLEEGIVDSTGVLELVMFVEETFGFEVDDEEILPENFDSVRGLAGYVRLRAGNAKQ